MRSDSYLENIGSAPSLDASSVKELDQKAWRAWDQKKRNADAEATNLRLMMVGWCCIALLLGTVPLERYAMRFDLELKAMITAGAALLAYEAMRTGRYAFTALFVGIVLLYNPVVPAFVLAGGRHYVIALATAIPFAASLIWLNSDASAGAFRLYPNRGWGRMRAPKASR